MTRKPRPVRMYARHTRISRHIIADGAMVEAVRDEAVDGVLEAVRLDACEPHGPLLLSVSDSGALDWVQNVSTLLAEQRAVPLPFAPVRRLWRRFAHGFRRGSQR